MADTREAQHHELKTWPVYFKAVESGEKRFEVRRNDRDFRTGDTVKLREWDERNGYSGREFRFRIGYVLRDFPPGQPAHVVFALEALASAPSAPQIVPWSDLCQHCGKLTFFRITTEDVEREVARLAKQSASSAPQVITMTKAQLDAIVPPEILQSRRASQEEPTQATRIEAAFREGYDFGQADRRFDVTDADDAWSKGGTRKALEALSSSAPAKVAVDVDGQRLVGLIKKHIEAHDECYPHPLVWWSNEARNYLRDALALLSSSAPAETAPSICKVRAAGITDPPQDCDWPFCGCDPHADKVIAHLQECGMLVAGDGDTTPYNCFDPSHVPAPAPSPEWEDSTRPYPQRFRQGAPDPIAAAVDAQLDPLKDELKALGRTLAKEE